MSINRFRGKIDPSEFKVISLVIHKDILRIMKNQKLSIYLTALISISNQKATDENPSPMFCINKEHLELFKFNIPNARTRTRYDNILSYMEIIKVNFHGIPRRKYYSINFEKLKSICETSAVRPNGRTSSAKCHNSKDISLLHKDILTLKPPSAESKFRDKPIRKIKRRKKKPSESVKIIDYWSSLGKPFAKVRKIDSLAPIIDKFLVDNKSKEIIHIIDRGFDYMSNPLFKFKNTNHNISMKQFFERGSFSYADDWLRSHRLKTWFHAFKLKGDSWLQSNILKTVESNNSEIYNFLIEVLEYRNDNFEIKNSIAIGSNNMLKFMKKNGFPQSTMFVDFRNFLKAYYPDTRKFKTFWLKSKKFWNTTFARYLVEYGRYKSTQEIKDI